MLTRKSNENKKMGFWPLLQPEVVSAPILEAFFHAWWGQLEDVFQQRGAPWVRPTDQPDNAIPENIKHSRFLTGNVWLDSLNKAGWVEGGDYGSRDGLQEQVLANTAQARVLVNLFRPGGHLKRQ